MPQSSPGFNLTTFATHWASLDAKARTDLISRAGFFSPSLGILPILKGLFSYHFNEKTAALKSLEHLLSTINSKLDNPLDVKEFEQGQGDALRVSGKIYQQLSGDLAFADKNLIFSTLVGLGDQGTFFAFKALYQDRLSKDVLSKCIPNMTEYQRLVFVDQYLQAPPEIRLRFASIFKNILVGLQDRESVIAFYADLFDRKRDVDPFLNNINYRLRNADFLMEREIVSQSPEVRVKGLKALSMVQAKIPVRILKNALWGEKVKKVRMAVYSLVENSSMGLYPELFDPLFVYLQGDSTEAFQVFKALVVTGRHPFHKLICLVRKSCPQIIPIIHLEISDLSRLSFFCGSGYCSEQRPVSERPVSER